METTTISTNMIYEFLREFKSDVHSRFEQLEKRMDRMENQQLEDRKMLMDLWQSRDNVTIKFSRTFMGVNAFLSCLIATIVAISVKR